MAKVWIDQDACVSDEICTLLCIQKSLKWVTMTRPT